MSEMVEKVKAALRALPVRDSRDIGGELDELRLGEAARAAIEAMLENTAAMSFAGADAVQEGEEGDPWITEFDADNVWRAMIDEALK